VKRMGLLVGVLLLGGIGAGVLALRSWPMINIVETGRTPEYPDIQPRTYQKPTAEVFDAALHVINRLSRWSLVGYDEKQGDIQAEARTALWRFVDDVRIRVRSREGVTVVEVRSASRVGRGDFGQNARRIRGFLMELDRQLAITPGH
jgi:uncharacterized protein (DUF1499 family)